MKSPQQHPQADQTHSAAPSTSQPRQAQQASPDAVAIAHSPRMTAQRQAIRAAFGPNAAAAQLQGDAEQQLLDEMPVPAAATQRAAVSEDAPNLTGMPSQLKSGIEALSGMDMSEVRVHRSSDKPVQLNALAYAQGNEIHLGPGQERHLGHEAWHVVQRRQGRVKATVQMAGMGMNDDAGLEREADLMGGKAEGGLVQLVGDGKRQDLTPNLLMTPNLLGDTIHNSHRILAQRQKVDVPVGCAVRQTAGEASSLLASPDCGDSAIQLVARTQTVDLVTTGAPPSQYMRVAGGGAGQGPMDASVGVAKALGTDGWGGVAIAPTAEYWRAHALAEVLGGQGDNTNVGWWTKADEDAWTVFEEKAQGRKGPAFDPEFQPGAREKGSYQVDSNNVQVDIKPNFVAGITAAVNELNNATLNHVGTAAISGVATQAGVNWGAALTAARNQLRAVAAGRINTWLDVVFAPTAGGPFAWTSLVGTYQRDGAPGDKKGRQRTQKMEQTQTPTPLLAANFGIAPGSEAALWALMRDANDGVYSKGNNPFRNLSMVIAVNDATSEVGKFRFTIGAHTQINVDFI